MVALFILLFAVAISIFINRIATQALMLTGLSRDVAEFQSRSITTGTGFTTEEAESLLNHPARRRIAMFLMLIQNAGLITVISTFVLSFVNTETTGIALIRGVILIGGIAGLIFLAKNDWVTRQIQKLIDWMLENYTRLRVLDYHTLLNLQEGYTISRLKVSPDSWLSDKKLENLDLKSEGIMTLSIENTEGTINGVPTGEDTPSAGDVLTLYGKENNLSKLKDRLDDAAGDKAHEDAKEAHQKEQHQNN